MATKKRKPTRREAMLRAIVECSTALSRANAHFAVTQDDLASVLGAVYSLHVERGQKLRLTVER